MSGETIQWSICFIFLRYLLHTYAFVHGIALDEELL